MKNQVIHRCDVAGDCVGLWRRLWGVVWVVGLGAVLAGYMAYQGGVGWLWGMAGVGLGVALCEWRTLRTPDVGWAGPVELGLMAVVGIGMLRLVEKVLEEGRSWEAMGMGVGLLLLLVVGVVMCRWNDRWCERVGR